MSPILRSLFYSCRLPVPKERLPFDLSLYLVANRPSFQNEEDFFSRIKASVEGGVTCVQLRDHESDLQTTIRTAQRLKNLLRDVPLFINTPQPFEVVEAVQAEGLFLEGSYPYSDARKGIGDKAILGVVVKTWADLIKAGQTDDIDYISVKIFPSKITCPKNDSLWGMFGARIIPRITPHPIVFIGGLTLPVVERTYRKLSPHGIAMASGIIQTENPCLTAQMIRAIQEIERGAV